ncbi:MAG: hypothetical protein ACRBN8_37910 [Nannocystales bacterium]
MSEEGPPITSEVDDGGFSAFLHAVAAAPPPERGFATGAEVGPGYRISRRLPRNSEDSKVYLAGGEDGDVALLRRMGVRDVAAYLELLDRWSEGEASGRVALLWAGSSGHEEVVVACDPVPAGTLRAWLKEGPHPWSAVCARLGPVASALAAAHDVDVYGFSFDPDSLWLSLDGRALLTLPEPSGTPARDRDNLRALARAALGDSGSLPSTMRSDRPGDPKPTRTLARGFGLARRRRLRWAGLATSVAVSVLFAVALHEPRSRTYDDAPLLQAPRTAETWTVIASRIDAGDVDAASLVDAFEHDGHRDPVVRARVALLRVHLADDAAGRHAAIQRAVAAAEQTQAPGVRFSTALVQAEEALDRGALLEAQAHLSRARRWTTWVGGASRRPLRRLSWTVDNAARVSSVRAPEVMRASERLVSPSLERVALRILLGNVWAAQGFRAMALTQLSAVTGVPRAQPAWIQFELAVASAHLAIPLGRLDDASSALDRADAHSTTASERASSWLARAFLARCSGDRVSAEFAIDEAVGELGTLEGHGLQIDLRFERAAWLLHGGAPAAALDELDAALTLHDAIRGPGARSRVPLELAYRRALEGDTRLMSEAPPSRA